MMTYKKGLFSKNLKIHNI